MEYMKRSKSEKIYNLKQANYLLKNNATAIGTDVSDTMQGRRIYIEFKRDNIFDVAMEKWKSTCREFRKNKLYK